MTKINIDYKAFRRRCLMTETEYQQEFEGNIFDIVGTKNEYYIYLDNNAPVLAVAHLDTVQHPLSVRHFHKLRMGKEGQRKTYVFNAQLDDRLGAYIILDLLPQLLGAGRYDVLLTTGEETGRTTAAHFTPSHEYNWLFEFDRRSDDTVLYGFDTPTWRTTLKSYGFDIGHGSFSDISVLGRLGVKAANFGCGYYDNHSELGYAIMGETAKQVSRFLEFFEENVNTKFPHQPTVYHKRGAAVYYSWRDADDDNWGENGKSTVAGTTSSTPPTSTHTKYPSIKGKNPPEDMSWVTGKNINWFTFTGSKGGKYKIFMHPDGWQATHCCSCGRPDYLENYVWTQDTGLPICWECDMTGSQTAELALDKRSLIAPELLAEHKPDELTWLDEGGVLVQDAATGGWKRNDVSADSFNCALCDECEWVEKLVEIDNEIVICRWCAGEIETEIMLEESPEGYPPLEDRLSRLLLPEPTEVVVTNSDTCLECGRKTNRNSAHAKFLGLCSVCAKAKQ